MPGSFYLSGLILGVGLCGFHCALLLAPVAARTAGHWKQGIRTALLFALGKVLILSFYGALATAAGGLIYRLIGHRVISFAAGMALAALGVWFLLGSARCGRISRNASPLLLGIIDGLTPCGATTGFLLYLAPLGLELSFGLFAGLLFGLGTVTSPLLFVCGVTPSFWSRLVRFRYSRLVLRILGSTVFFVWSLALMIQGRLL